MYKCKECGAEYKEKPDYCDCGNDEFESIAEVPAEVKPEIKSMPKREPQPAPKTVYVKPEPKEPKTFAEQYPSIARFFAALDPISCGIFVICLILSFYVVFFAWNVNEEIISEQPKEQPVVSKNIPNSVDKFWNNALPVVKEEPKPVQPTIVEEVKKIIAPQPKSQVVNKPVQQVKTAPKVTSVKLTKNSAKTTTAQKTKTQTTVTQKPAQTQTKQSQTKTAQTQPAQQLTPTPTVQQPVTTQKSAAEIAAEKAEKARQLAQAKVEYANYKAALRNTIGRKIDFTKVVGDGSCTVTFQINSSGRLVNRSFSKQSTNITLNDAVYSAVMATPSYNPPPSVYNNEKLNLNISFYNGNFEISLK